MNKDDIIIGQECITPDGLGRVIKVTEGICEKTSITVDTYANNRGCNWDSCNIELIDPRQNSYLKETTHVAGELSFTEKSSVPGKVHVIMCSNYPQFVSIGSLDGAKNKLDILKISMRDKYQGSEEEYEASVSWRIKTVDAE